MASTRFVIATIGLGTKYAVMEISKPDAPELASPTWLRAICINQKIARRFKHALNHRCESAIQEQEDSGVWRNITRDGLYEKDLKRVWKFSHPFKLVAIYQTDPKKPGFRKLLALALSQADAQLLTTVLNHTCDTFKHAYHYSWWLVGSTLPP
jgi:hypothetical protein